MEAEGAPMPDSSPLALTMRASISAEFQRGQYPDSVARGKLAAATSLPEDTVRVSELCHAVCTAQQQKESGLRRLRGPEVEKGEEGGNSFVCSGSQTQDPPRSSADCSPLFPTHSKPLR